MYAKASLRLAFPKLLEPRCLWEMDLWSLAIMQSALRQASGDWYVRPSSSIKKFLMPKQRPPFLFVSLSSGSIGMEEELDRSRQQKSAD